MKWLKLYNTKKKKNSYTIKKLFTGVILNIIIAKYFSLNFLSKNCCN